MLFMDEIRGYEPFDDTEAAYKTRVLALLEKHKGDVNVFDRSHLEGHITGSALVVNQTRDKVYMILHKKLGFWMQPGGHCDGDEDVAQGALREVLEETGFTDVELIPSILDIDIHPVPEMQKHGKTEPAHDHFDVRYMVIANEDEVPSIQEEEILQGKWFTFEEAATMNPWRNFTRMLDKVMA